jgi:hypothetical protein
MGAQLKEKKTQEKCFESFVRGTFVSSCSLPSGSSLNAKFIICHIFVVQELDEEKRTTKSNRVNSWIFFFSFRVNLILNSSFKLSKKIIWFIMCLSSFMLIIKRVIV